MGCASSTDAAGLARCGSWQRTFVLGSTLGQGSFGEVRAVVGESAIDNRAVKVLPLSRSGSQDKCRRDDVGHGADVCASDPGDAEGGGPDARLLAQARQEAKIWKQIGKHEHCVQLYSAFEQDGTFFMVMELCGSSVFDQRKELMRLECNAASLFRSMLIGLSHLHHRRIVHRDVKPENFLLGGQDGTSVKLCDFGLAAYVPRSKLLFGSYGTVPYMSPEMVGNVGHSLSTDMWSFGTAAYLLLFEDLPYLPAAGAPPAAGGEAAAIRQTILLGQPAPRFACRGHVDAGRQPSEQACSFARSLLKRCLPQNRLTAQQVMRLPFLRTGLNGIG